MRKITYSVIGFMFFVFSVVSIATPIPPKRSQIRLKSANFYVIDLQGNSRISSTLDYSKEHEYGWKIEFTSKKKQHELTEVITLPAPANWGVGPNTKISRDQRSASTRYTLNSDTRQFSHRVFWKYAQGDPPGLYLFDIYIEGEKIHTFRILVSL